MAFTSRNVALVAVFAALYYVLSLITPFVPAVGLPALKISLEALIASVFGLVLGPYLGMAAAFGGAIVTWALTGMSPTSAPFLLSPPINALIVGLVFYRKWKWGFAVFALLIAAFLFLPPSQPLQTYYYVPVSVLWDKIIALALIIPSVILAKRFNKMHLLPLLFFFLCFVGNQADNIWGSDVFAVPFVYEVLYGLDVNIVRSLFVISPFVYPAIRLVQAFVATVVAVPLMRVLKSTNWVLREKSIVDE